MPKISVIVSTYRRYKNLKAILEGWLQQSDEVILIDSSKDNFISKLPEIKSLPISIVTISPDYGNKIRHAITNITKGDYIILADDDLLPKPNLAQDLYQGYKTVGGDTIVGLIGRQFNKKKLYKDTTFFRADNIDKPIKTDFVGVVYFTPREFIGFDVRDLENAVDDLYWQLKIFPNVNKYVVPTKNYENLPECTDKGCLYRDPKSKVIRQKFYEEYYLKYYK